MEWKGGRLGGGDAEAEEASWVCGYELGVGDGDGLGEGDLAGVGGDDLPGVGGEGGAGEDLIGEVGAGAKKLHGEVLANVRNTNIWLG